ncbi:MAG: NADH-quinone oxidoreductase subunit NuoH [Chloroflexota bacterium]|nr:NADH-quinone oxidoreductase subunit NuoH [Chloroflexota bacterium]
MDFSETGILSFHGIYGIFALFLPGWLAYAATCGVLAFIVINTMVMATALYTWFERRMIGRFQARLGPNRWGPFGILQPFADVIKLIVKEDTVPSTADKIVFALAPIALFAPTVLTIAIIPFGESTFVGKLNIGVLFLIGVTSVNTVAVLAAGFASRNKYAMLGSMRGVAMLCSYEVPMALALVGVVLIANSMSLYEIVQAQSVPFLLVQPLGFFVFMAAASAEMSRTPFDQIEAESELGSGYHTEYSGMKFAIFQLAEFMAPIVVSIIAVVLFFGGTRGFDPIPGQLWFIIKVVLVLFGLLWIRATWPRLRIDQIMGFAWKGLFALAILNIFVIAIEVMLFQDGEGNITTRGMWTMAAVNWAITLAAIAIMVNVLGGKKLERPAPKPSPLANMYAEAD